MKRLIITLALATVCVVSRATPASDSVEVDLATAIEVALNRSPVVKIADREIQRTEYSRKEQLSSLLPQLGVGASYNRAIQKQKMSMDFGGGTNVIEVGSSNTVSAGLNLALPLVAPALWKTMQLKEIDIELAAEASRDSRIATIGAVQEAYYSLLMARDSYEVLQVSYQNAEFSAKIASDKFDQGLVSEFDKLRAEVQLRNQRPQLVAAESSIRLATMNLKVLMGIDIKEALIFTGRLSDFESEMAQDMNLFDADTSLSRNSTLRQIDIQIRQLEKARQITRSSYLPTLSLSGNYQWSSMSNDFRIGNYNWFPYATAGLSLNIPIYMGSAKRHQLSQNRITIEQTELQRENLARTLAMSVRASLNDIERSIEEVGSNRQSVIQAEHAFRISQRRYEVGSGNLLELNDSEVALTRSRLSLNQSIYNYLSARSALETTIGKAVESNKLATPNNANK